MALLLILAVAASALLVYEGLTLVGSVWRPLLANPQALQTDFHYYYEAAARFLANRAELYRASDDVIAGFAYPPPAIVPFMWLSRLPLGLALVLMTALSYFALLWALHLWAAHIRREASTFSTTVEWLAITVAVSLGPVYMNAIFGQVNVFVLASAIAFVVFSRTSAVGAGAALAGGVLLKIYPALLALVGMWDRAARRALLWSAAAAVAMVVLLLPIVPMQSYAAYLDVLRTRGDKTAIHITNQSLSAFVERLSYPPAQFLNWTGDQAVTVTGATQVANWMMVAAVAALLAFRATKGQHVAASAGMIALIAVAAPLGWGHTYVMILPLLMMHLVVMPQTRGTRAMITAMCVAALMVPAGKRLAFVEHAPALAQNLFYSRYLIASLTLILLPLKVIGRTTEHDRVFDS